MTLIEIGFVMGGLVGIILGGNEIVKLIIHLKTRDQHEQFSQSQSTSLDDFDQTKSIQATIRSDRLWVNIFLGTLSLIMSLGWFYMLFMIGKEHPIREESLSAFLFLVAIGAFFLFYGIFAFLRGWKSRKQDEE